MLKRSFDAERINAVVNHPAVRPFVGGADLDELDVTPLVNAPEHWFLMDEHGGFMLAWSAPDVREVHTFVTPEGRGQWAADRRAEMLDYARANGTKTLWTKIPDGLPHVERFARQGGMRPTNDVLETLGKVYRVFSMELN